MENQKCRRCGEEYPADGKYCSACGAAAKLKCEICDNTVSGLAVKCPHCGHPINSAIPGFCTGLMVLFFALTAIFFISAFFKGGNALNIAGFFLGLLALSFLFTLVCKRQ